MPLACSSASVGVPYAVATRNAVPVDVGPVSVGLPLAVLAALAMLAVGVTVFVTSFESSVLLTRNWIDSPPDRSAERN